MKMPSRVGSGTYSDRLNAARRVILAEALEEAQWNVSAAAHTLGISRVGLSKCLRVLGIRRPAKSTSER